ncbi:GGDEF domain-containing protein [Kineosporia sp. J2-2]|uniref:GGDEF domain-containing protein n=1 Tax=Kineosporia corallincola TaxID=2835133 RepID=A0ABS5TB86_9ACTN|nr:GGDEF domain-containing protein [Kineosporia corallincola]MBT0768325.1 GGDEF domain-containing protein [Kineosporia corallincola]
MTWEGTPEHVRRIGLAILGGMATLTVLSLFWEREGSDAMARTYLVSTAVSSLFLLLAVLRVPRPRRGPWLWIMANMALCLTGELVLGYYQLTGDDRWPTPADAFFLTAYLATAIGVLGLNRQRGGRPAFGAVLDALIVAVGVGVLALVFVVLPLAWDTAQPLVARTVGTLYPLLDVMLLFLLLRIFAHGRPGAAVSWVAASMLCTLVADTAQNLVELTSGGNEFAVWMNVVWACAYLFMGFAAAASRRDPGPRPAPDPATTAEAGLTAPRLGLLAFGAGLPSVVVIGRAANGVHDGATWLGLGSLLLLAMVVTRIAGLLAQLRRRSEEMALMARTDPLTGVANRRSWDFDLDRAMGATRTGGGHLLVALLDLDHFKRYNDTQGHQAGDDLLREAAGRWHDALGPHPVIARWGGEEFVALVHCADPEQGRHRLDSLRRVVPHGQTVSLGIARWDGQEDATGLLRRADTALYLAKEQGRDRSVSAPQPAAAPALDTRGPGRLREGMATVRGSAGD